MFKFHWNKFNVKLGLIFMISVTIVFGIMGKFNFPIFAAGISAILAWVTILLVPDINRSQHIMGLLVYLIIGTGLTWFAGFIEPFYWARLLSMGIITFIGYLWLLKGVHPFIVAWCLVYWFLLAPLFLSETDVKEVILGHFVGTTIVIFLISLKPIWSLAINKKFSKSENAVNKNSSSDASTTEKPKVGFVIRYAFVVSMSITGGVAAGMRWLVTDPTIIANATLNMITPSLKQTWYAGVERIVLGGLGIIGGFYFGWFFPDQWIGYLVIAVCSFLALATIYVNISLLVGIIFFLIAYPWGTMQSDIGNIIANEKLLGEIIGIAVAIIAIALLAGLSKIYNTTR